MNVLHFGCGYLPGSGGNVVRMTHMLEHNKCGNALFVMTTTNAGNFNDDAYYAQTGIHIIRIGALDEAKTKLPEVIQKYSIDIVVTHVIPANLIACQVLPKDIIVMTEIHSLITSSPIKMIGKDLLHRLYLDRRTSCFFTLSKGAGHFISKHYGISKNKICFLPNGISHLDHLRRESGNQRYFTFGYIGTFYYWQGTGIVLENAERILAIGPNVRLYMIGGGEQEKAFFALKNKYPGRVVVTGLVSKQEADCMAKEIDVLLIPRPSTLESNTAIPLKLFDSVQYKKPVIMSDVFGLTEVFSEQEAFVYKNAQSDGLIQMCEYVYSHPEEMDVKFSRAVQRLEQWPTWDEIHLRQNEVFQRCRYQ